MFKELAIRHARVRSTHAPYPVAILKAVGKRFVARGSSGAHSGVANQDLAHTSLTELLGDPVVSDGLADHVGSILALRGFGSLT